MLENLSSTQKAVAGVAAIAGVVGWVFAFVQVGEVDSLRSELEPAQQSLASAKDDLTQLQGDLEAAQSERSELQQRVEATETLKELTAAQEAGEPPRDCRRLQLLRGWSYDKENIGKIFT